MSPPDFRPGDVVEIVGSAEGRRGSGRGAGERGTVIRVLDKTWSNVVVRRERDDRIAYWTATNIVIVRRKEPSR